MRCAPTTHRGAQVAWHGRGKQPSTVGYRGPHKRPPAHDAGGATAAAPEDGKATDEQPTAILVRRIPGIRGKGEPRLHIHSRLFPKIKTVVFRVFQVFRGPMSSLSLRRCLISLPKYGPQRVSRSLNPFFSSRASPVRGVSDVAQGDPASRENPGKPRSSPHLQARETGDSDLARKFHKSG